MADNYFPGQGIINLFTQPEAPSPAPAPVPQPSVIYAEPIETHNNREIIQLKEKIKSLEEENKSLKAEMKAEMKEMEERIVGIAKTNWAGPIKYTDEQLRRRRPR